MACIFCSGGYALYIHSVTAPVIVFVAGGVRLSLAGFTLPTHAQQTMQTLIGRNAKGQSHVCILRSLKVNNLITSSVLLYRITC